MHTRQMPLAVLLMLVIAACERGAPTVAELHPILLVNVETTTAGTPPDSADHLGTSM